MVNVPLKKILENIRSKLAIKEVLYGNDAIQSDYENLSTILIGNGSRYGVHVQNTHEFIQDTELKTQLRLAMRYYEVYLYLQLEGARLFPSLQLDLIKFYKKLKKSIEGNVGLSK
jgi:hypothetical protein